MLMDYFTCLFQNTQVTEAWNKIAESFKCTAIEGKMHADDLYVHCYMKEQLYACTVVLY